MLSSVIIQIITKEEPENLLGKHFTQKAEVGNVDFIFMIPMLKLLIQLLIPNVRCFIENIKEKFSKWIIEKEKAATKNKFQDINECFENVEESSSSTPKNPSSSRNPKSKPSIPSTHLTDPRYIIAERF